MVDERREGLTKNHLPDATVPEMSAKEMQVGNYQPPSTTQMGPYLVGGSQYVSMSYIGPRVAISPWSTNGTLNVGVLCSRMCLSRIRVENSQKYRSGLPLPTVCCLTHLGSVRQHPPCGSSLHSPTVLPGRHPEMSHCLGIPLHLAIWALNQGQRQHYARQLWPGHSPAAGTQLLHLPGPRSHHTLCPKNLHARIPLVQSSHPHPQTREARLPLERGQQSVHDAFGLIGS